MVCSACISLEGARPVALNVSSSTRRSVSVTKERLSTGAFGAATTLVSSACTAPRSTQALGQVTLEIQRQKAHQ